MAVISTAGNAAAEKSLSFRVVEPGAVQALDAPGLAFGGGRAERQPLAARVGIIREDAS